MQKQKINYLTLQSTYDQIEVALFNNEQLLTLTHISKFTASSQLIPIIKACLTQNSLNLVDLNFICANLGPAPFTTLRTTIVTVNGLSYATKIPLVGVNGLDVFARTAKPAATNLIVILNAFSKSVYYAIRSEDKISYGWQMLDTFLLKMQTKFTNQPVLMIGLGISNFKDELADLPSNFIIDQDFPGYPNLELIAQAGLMQYQNGLVAHELSPLYLKQAEPLK